MKSSGSCFYREDTGSLKSKMSSIEFCKLNLAFEGGFERGSSPIEICKSYRVYIIFRKCMFGYFCLSRRSVNESGRVATATEAESILLPA